MDTDYHEDDDDLAPEWAKSVSGTLLIFGIAVALVFATTYLFHLVLLGLMS